MPARSRLLAVLFVLIALCQPWRSSAEMIAVVDETVDPNMEWLFIDVFIGGATPLLPPGRIDNPSLKFVFGGTVAFEHLDIKGRWLRVGGSVGTGSQDILPPDHLDDDDLGPGGGGSGSHEEISATIGGYEVGVGIPLLTREKVIVKKMVTRVESYGSFTRTEFFHQAMPRYKHLELLIRHHGWFVNIHDPDVALIFDPSVEVAIQYLQHNRIRLEHPTGPPFYRRRTDSFRISIGPKVYVAHPRIAGVLDVRVSSGAALAAGHAGIRMEFGKVLSFGHWGPQMEGYVHSGSYISFTLYAGMGPVLNPFIRKPWGNELQEVTP